MTDPRFDFRALDPARDPDFDARIAAIVSDAMTARREPRALEAPASVFDDIARWTRPALAAAAVIALLSLPALARSFRAPAAPAASDIALRPYDQVTAWAHTNHDPTPVELFGVIEAPVPPPRTIR